MAKVSVGLPQGTRDFGPDVVRKRNYIFDTIRSVFELYGFQPLETPAMENLETLMGKYGEDGDKLIFRILDSGNPFSESFFVGLWEYLRDFNNEVSKNSQEDYPNGGPLSNWNLLEYSPAIISTLAQDLFDDPILNKKYLSRFKNELSSKALKYDLTIPFARYVAMNHGKLTFPFKRYQIQPVWRGDKPQRGRYREFYQCDADIVGSNSLLNEIELTNIYLLVFNKLGIQFDVKINNRKILQGIAEFCGYTDKLNDITTALDKLDKIGVDKVKSELVEKGIPSNKIDLIFECLTVDEEDLTNEMCLDCVGIDKLFLTVQEQKIACLKYKFWSKEIVSGMTGCDELLEIFDSIKNQEQIKFDVSLARGLNYYTGTIFEVTSRNVKMGSIGGGGRYDDLTSLFGVPNTPGVGISFGVDRIYDVMEESGLFKGKFISSVPALFFNTGDDEVKLCLSLMQQLRENNIGCELYHEKTKFDKQFRYAERKGIPYVVIIAQQELTTNSCLIKDLRKGVQESIPTNQLVDFFKEII